MSIKIPIIKVHGEKGEISSTYHLLSVEVNHQVNKIPSARLTYIDAKGYVGKPYASQDEDFRPGKTIEISLYDAESTLKNKTIFKGLIVQHRIKYNDNDATLVLELRHAALNLTTSRNNSVFTDQSDEDIFDKIVRKYSSKKITFSSKVGTKKHKQMIQAWCSDWDFILSRAESNGLWLICGIDSDGYQLKLIDPNKIDNLKLTLDLNAASIIYAIDLCIDIENQIDKISATSWNVDRQEISPDKAQIIQSKVVPEVDFKKLGSSTGYNLYHPGNIGEDELNTWVLGRKTRNDFSLFKGKIKLPGRLDIDIGVQVELKNLGRYFNGRHVICSVNHVIDEDGFQTEIGIGIPVDGLITMQSAEPPSAGAMLPAIKGLYIGIVEGYAAKNDDGNRLLVKVKLPLFNQGGGEVWGRLSSIYAGADRGVVFRPEIGDEVVLGFFNDDPRYPVILGSMYSAKNKPPVEFNEANNEKAIITRGKKITILLDDEQKSIVLKTSEHNKIGILDETGISLEDKNNNSVILNADGISCSSKKDAKISSEGLTIETQRDTKISSKKVSIKAQKVDIE